MKIRIPKFNLQKLSHHYFKGNIFSTHLANSLHIMFPEGEKFFIRSCRKFLSQIKDEQLKKQVKLFMGQEGMHSKAHEDFWQYLEQQGFKVYPLANFLDKTAFEGIEKWIYKLLGEKKGSELCLSMTAGLEHYTALLAEVAFENEDEFRYLPEEMRQLWFWHAAEEIEHKSVAYDLLQHINDDQILKNSGFALATSMLFFYTLIGQAYFVLTDKKGELSDYPRELLDYTRSLANPLTRKFISNMADYLRKDFHPSQMENDFYATDFFNSNERYQAHKKTA